MALTATDAPLTAMQRYAASSATPSERPLGTSSDSADVPTAGSWIQGRRARVSGRRFDPHLAPPRERWAAARADARRTSASPTAKGVLEVVDAIAWDEQQQPVGWMSLAHGPAEVFAEAVPFRLPLHDPASISTEHCHSTVVLQLRIPLGHGADHTARRGRERPGWPRSPARSEQGRKPRQHKTAAGRGRPGVRCRGGAGGGRRVARRRMGAGHVSWPGRIM